VVAADFRKLNVRQPSVRLSTPNPDYPRAEEVCRRFDIPFLNVPHDSLELKLRLAEIRPTLGVILGARILDKEVISSFSKGILNLHPGLLPWNRGLDNIMWAILNNVPQGVTAHLIDERIDAGHVLYREAVRLSASDSIRDLSEMVHNLEMRILPFVVRDLKNLQIGTLDSEFGPYHASLEIHEEHLALEKYPLYAAKHDGLVRQLGNLESSWKPEFLI
jgi:methionyl-tRNA formyltransferase